MTGDDGDDRDRRHGHGHDDGERRLPGAVEDVVPAVGAVVVEARADGDRVLVVRRRGGDWTIPFGRVEPGESVPETVRRELREEVSLDACVERLAGVYSDPSTQVFEHRSGRTLHFVTTVVVCSVAGDPDPEPVPVPDGEELDRARFVHPGEMPEMSFLGEWVRSALDGATTLQ